MLWAMLVSQKINNSKEHINATIHSIFFKILEKYLFLKELTQTIWLPFFLGIKTSLPVSLKSRLNQTPSIGAETFTDICNATLSQIWQCDYRSAKLISEY